VDHWSPVKPVEVDQFETGGDKADREHFAVLFLDAMNKPTGANIVSIGTLTETQVHPREVFKGAFLANAKKIVIAHNHPAGAAMPSADDLTLTTVLVRAGKLLGIPVVDHVIVSPDGSYFSLHEANLMGERALRETTNS